MNAQRHRIAHVRHMAEQLERVDKGSPGRSAAFDLKDHHATTLASQVLLIFLKLTVALQAREAHPIHLVVRLQVLGNCKCILTMALHTQRQGFNPLQDNPRIVG